MVMGIWDLASLLLTTTINPTVFPLMSTSIDHIISYVTEVPKGHICRVIHTFSLYSPSLVSSAAAQEALAANDKDLAAIRRG